MYRDLKKNILVVGNEDRDNQIHVTMPIMPTSHGRTSKTGRTTTISIDTEIEMGAHHHRLRCRTTELATGL